MYKNRFRRLQWTRAELSPSKRTMETQECIIWSTLRWIQRDHLQLFRRFCCDICIFFWLYLIRIILHKIRSPWTWLRRPPHICALGQPWIDRFGRNPWEFGPRTGELQGNW